MTEQPNIRLSIEQVNDYEFRIRFDGTALPALTTDEAAPLGHDAGPNPTRLLLAGVANCLTASLLFALRKFRNQPGTLHAEAEARLGRNASGRWRVAQIDVDIKLADTAATLQNLERALAQFENFCVVTESVRTGVPVSVQVHDAGGALLHSSVAPAAVA
ncbi:MAG: OsmC family protein [Gammaproteobacteria bacterium]